MERTYAMSPVHEEHAASSQLTRPVTFFTVYVNTAPQEKDSLMGELESLIAQMEDLVREKDAAGAAAEAACRDADALAAQLDTARLEAGEAVRAAQAECEQLQAEVRAQHLQRTMMRRSIRTSTWCKTILYEHCVYIVRIALLDMPAMQGADSNVSMQLDDAAAQLQSSRGGAEQSKQLAARVRELQVHACSGPSAWSRVRCC